VKQGYKRSWFDKVFDVYASDPPSKVEQPEQRSNDAGFSGFSNRNIDPLCSTLKSAENPHEHCDVPVVPDEKGGNRGVEEEIDSEQHMEVDL